MCRDAAKSGNLGGQVVMQSKILTSVSYKAPSDLPKSGNEITEIFFLQQITKGSYRKIKLSKKN